MKVFGLPDEQLVICSDKELVWVAEGVLSTKLKPGLGPEAVPGATVQLEIVGGGGKIDGAKRDWVLLLGTNAVGDTVAEVELQIEGDDAKAVEV